MARAGRGLGNAAQPERAHAVVKPCGLSSAPRGVSWQA
ncbi:hypothetical protein Salmuc_04395 [Salipiger mucosus DSM 16094]|uniref:Uncharacterized protein n=1 Tax=Salipiger mucosus DSM 16094 TaxID=1123237 RepID=S9QGR9_9RHOB|nr:hypothetical protein Salmuc_04395 [Salipiger mucosus DSM 16094]